MEKITNEQLLQQWRDNKCVGALLVDREDIADIVDEILRGISSKNKSTKVLVISNDRYYNLLCIGERTNNMDIIRSDINIYELEERCSYYNVVIIVDYKSCSAIHKAINKAKFWVYINAVGDTALDIFSFDKYGISIFSNVPPVEKPNEIKSKRGLANKTVVNQKAISTTNKINTEDFEIINISFSDSENTEYDRLTAFILETINIFGSFENIEKCRVGDRAFNISPEKFRESIAFDNGWSYNLNYADPYSRVIDDMYNPNILRERIGIFYRCLRERANLSALPQSKLDWLLDYIQTNESNRIIICCDTSPQAIHLTNFLNESCNEIVCRCVCSSVPSEPMVDENGCTIFNKSGKARTIGAKKLNERSILEFERNFINVLVVTPTIKLEKMLDVDVYISLVKPTVISNLSVKSKILLNIEQVKNKNVKNDNFVYDFEKISFE